MKLEKTDRGFWNLVHPTYPPTRTKDSRLVSESSVILYDDALDHPGSSALWLGENHHLNREEVKELVGYLQRWLETGRLGENS